MSYRNHRPKPFLGKWGGRHLPIALVGLLLGSVVLAFGLATLVPDLTTLNDYAKLADEVAPDPEPTSGNGDDGTSSNHTRLPEGAAAWVTVDGTPISLPVADGSKGFDWYLTHDLWDHQSELGCPFMDPRCPSPDGAHVLVYGHHLSLTGAMFSPLHRCYHQEAFARLGTCLWRTRNGLTSFEPLCALSVEAHDQDAMRFSFSDEDDLRAWVGSIVKRSSARSADASSLTMQAQRVLTLVTCSSNLAGQPWRTLVFFVA